MDNNTSDTSEPYTGFTRADINYAGLGGIIAFYLLILLVGFFASWKKRGKETTGEDIMLAGRNLGLFIGVFTMTATWVGGGYINGTSEFVYTKGYGLAWTQAPWGYACGLFLGGLFYAKPMRDAEYVTMLDPFEQRYNSVVAGLCYIPALLGEIFWSGAILSALGGSLTVIIGLKHTYSVIISACIALLYTLVGGLFSVAFTDVIQLICIAFGLLLAIPFALQHDAVGNIWDYALGTDGWVGKLEPDPVIGNWLDSALLLIMGGIPWQVYFQRVLACKTSRHAQLLSYLAGVGAILMSLPPIFIGAIGRATDWNATEYRNGGQIPMPSVDNGLILPLVVQFLTPVPVAVIALGAVSAAVMSSVDSSILSCSSMFAKNIYKPFRNAITQGCSEGSQASDKEILWVMRISILFTAAAAVAMAILVKSIYGLWYLCGDLVYVILFPQLTCAVHIPFTNTYGALCGWVAGMFFRLTGGESLLSLPPLIKYPYYNEQDALQNFPFKTLSMIICFFVILMVSYITKILFEKNILPKGADVLHCYNKTEPSAYELSGGKTNLAYVNDNDQKATYKRTIVY